MDITNNTALTQQALMFTDGSEGVFHQEHKLLADDVELGVKICVSGKNGKQTSRCFFVGGTRYEDVKEAIEAAGHAWLRDD